MWPFSSLFAALVLGAASPAQAQGQDILRGQDFARTNCARCHSIEKSGASPFSGAPPFRTLHLRYPVETLEEALAEGLFIGHPAMPEFTLDPGEIGDFIAFLKSLE